MLLEVLVDPKFECLSKKTSQSFTWTNGVGGGIDAGVAIGDVFTFLDGKGGGKHGTDEDWPGRTGGNNGCCGFIEFTRAD